MKRDREYIDLEPQFQTGRNTHENIVVDDVHPAFNLPLEQLVPRFKQRLRDLNADKTWENDYDDFEVFDIKCGWAIEAIVDHTDPLVKACAAPAAAAENVGPMAESTYDTWEDMAEAWLGQWVKLYNSILRDTIDDELAQLEKAITSAANNEYLSSADVRALSNHYIETNG